MGNCEPFAVKRFLDQQISHLLHSMENNGDLEDTIVIFTSDHGEEFNDLKKNYWGHGSNFSDFQTKVPLLMLWPGKESQTYTHRTSHFDIAPTVLSEEFKCINPTSDYSVGNNIFDPTRQKDWLLVYSYFNYGVISEDRIISTYPTGGYEVRDKLYNRTANATVDYQVGIELLSEVSRFYQ